MSSNAVSSKIRVLAVDDDPNVTWILTDGLNADDFEIEVCNDASTAISMLPKFHPDVCLLDIKMPGIDGIEALGHIKRFDPLISVIMVSGHADTPIVVRAMQGGAEEFLVKPFEVEMVEICIKNVLEKKDLKQRVNRLELELARHGAQDQFIGEAESIVKVRELIEQVGSTDLNVLIRGETGTGKDVVSRMIHQMSDRHQGPFVKVNCAALPSELLESELFGHERGAFTGAYKSKPGRFELADGGTIFLDEIGEMPASLQATLLQVLEQREFFRVGGTRNIKVDVRLITATNIDIERRIEEKQFRADLFYRLNDLTIYLPSLCERREDIPLLAQHFLQIYLEKFNKPKLELSPNAEDVMMQYPWPGNVRELESLMKRSAIFGEGEIVKYIERNRGSAGGPMVPSLIARPVETEAAFFEGKSLRDLNDEVMKPLERRAIEVCLVKNGWNRKRAAKDLSVSYRCLLYKIQEYELKQPGKEIVAETESDAPSSAAA